MSLMSLAGVKGLIFDVALPIADTGSDLIFTYNMYVRINFTLQYYMSEGGYRNDTCHDNVKNVSYTPSTENDTFFLPSANYNITCIESISGHTYTPFSLYEVPYIRIPKFSCSGNNALINIRICFVY